MNTQPEIKANDPGQIKIGPFCLTDRYQSDDLPKIILFQISLIFNFVTDIV